MLRERIAQLLGQPGLSHLSDRTQRTLVRAILLYLVGRESSEQLRRLSIQHEIAEPFYQFKSTCLDRTHYCASVFWRAVFGYFKHAAPRTGPTTTQMDPGVAVEVANQTSLSAKAQQGCAADLLLLESFLTLQDHQNLHTVALSSIHADPTSQDLVPTINELQRYCTRLVRTRMRFLPDHDNALSIQDLERELFEAALMTLHQYDAEPNRLKLLNTAKRGAKNHCVRLIEFHTAQCRARLVREHTPAKPYGVSQCGTCAWFDTTGPTGKTCQQAGARPSHQPCRQETSGLLYHARVPNREEQCGNCVHYDTAGPRGAPCVDQDVVPATPVCRHYEARVQVEKYSATTDSLDQPVRQEGEGGSLIDFIPAPQADPEWVRDLLGSLPERTGRVVQLVLGVHDRSFEEWLWCRTGEDSDQVRDRDLVCYACEFVGVDLAEVRDQLGPCLSHAVKAK